MASNSYQIFKVPDRELFTSLKAIVTDCGTLNDSRVTARLAKDHLPIDSTFPKIEEEKLLDSIFEAGTAAIYSSRVTFPKIRGTEILIERGGSSDSLTITFNNDTQHKEIIPLIASVSKHLKIFCRTESTDKLLGDELAEFYRRREQGLLRLEELTQKLVSQNEAYRKNLDQEYATQKIKLDNDLQSEKARLSDDFQKKEETLKEREKKLEERIKDLDDRDSRHARRQIRKDLKSALAERGQSFSLTKSTNIKRRPIHALFILLIIVVSIFFGNAFYDQINQPQNAEYWYLMLRFSLSAAALAAALIFYIRWNDQWFHQHADEEFKLKRLELDIDRASWVVEMAQEWKEEKGTELPEYLIACLSRNLFVLDSGCQKIKHPSEDLASALLEATSGLSLKIPGVGEAALTKSGLQRFKKNALEQEGN